MIPAAIEVDRAAGTVTIDWDGGRRSILPAERLRWACPCAVCAGEWGRPGRLSTLDTLPAEELRIADVLPVGSYALQFFWESGHNDGIYTFEYLHDLGSGITAAL